jgi:hypothetical protein
MLVIGKGVNERTNTGVELCPRSVDDVITAVDIERLAGDQLRPVHGEEGHRDPNVLDGDEAAGWRLGVGLGDQFVEIGEIDYYGEVLVGCINCNRWGKPGDKKLIMELLEDDLQALRDARKSHQ